MDDILENPRAVVGDNRAPAAAQMVTEQMQRDYAATVEGVDALLAEARTLPETIEDDETMGTYAVLIKKLRDTAVRLKAFHAAEKEPHLRAGQAVDQFFFGLWDKVVRRNVANKPGAADVLTRRLDHYQQRKLAAEQARLRAEAAEAARVAREAEAKRLAEEAAAEAARQAAERARKPETAVAKGAVADLAAERSTQAQANAAVAGAAAQEAHIASLARPADLVRTRVEGGPVVTMGATTWAEVTDSTALDKEKLWPFISEAEKAKALRAWAKNTGYTVPMEGADIGKGHKSRVV